MLPETQTAENVNAVRPIIKSTDRRKHCALMLYSSVLKVHLPGKKKMTTVPFFALLRRTQGISDSIKTFGAFE